MEYMCFNKTGDISTLNCRSLKLVNKFTYFGSSVSSTETDIDTRLAKAWTAINSLSVKLKSDLTDKMKRCFFQAAVMSILLYGCSIWTLTKRMEKSLTAATQECCEQYWISHGGNIPQSSSYTATYHLSRTLSKLDEPDMRDNAGEVETSLYVMNSYGPLQMAEQKQSDQLALIYNSSVRIRGVALRTCRKRWTIERGGERGSAKSLLMAWQDDDDEYLDWYYFVWLYSTLTFVYSFQILLLILCN